MWLAWAQAYLTPGLPSPGSHHLGTPAKEALACYGMSLERGAGHSLGEISSVSQDDLGQLPPPNEGKFPSSLSFSRVWASLLYPLQGQSEQTYSTVKTGAPAVTVTNLKPATRYVFQIRAASPGPSWEAQSFNPSIEVQTPGEGKWCAPGGC